MKKFFKALALVLALALVVGVLPTSEAQAAKTHKVVTTKTLFIGRSQGKKLSNGAACKTGDKVTVRYLADYSKEEAKKANVTFSAEVIEGKDYVKLNKSKTTVTALEAGIGKTAKVKVYVNGKEAGTATIKICKNATQESLIIKTQKENTDADTKAATPFVDLDADELDAATGLPKEFVAGVKYRFKVPQGGKDTDYRRLILNGLELIQNCYEADGVTLMKRNYTYTFPVEKAGTNAKIEIAAYQSDKFNGNTAYKTFSVPVIVKLITHAEQTTYNQFAVTFDTAEHAAQAIENGNEYLVSGVKPVTDKKFVIELFQDPDKDTTARKNVYIGKFEKSGASDKVVLCTVFGDLQQSAKYEVTYGEEEQPFNTVKWFPDAIRCSYSYEPADIKDLTVGGTATLSKSVVAINDDGHDVDLTAKLEDYIQWFYVEAPIENPANAAYYNVDGSDGSVVFTKNDKFAYVDVTFNYNNGTDSKELRDRIKATSAYAVKYAVKYYWTAPINQGETKTETKAEIYSNTTQQLHLSLVNTETGKVWYDCEEDANISFESSNEDSVSVYKDNDGHARLEAGNKNYDRTTRIYVKFLGDRIGYIDVTCWKAPKLASVKVAAVGGSKLSYATTAGSIGGAYGAYAYGVYVPAGQGTETFNFIGLDEHEYPYTNYTAVIEKISVDGLNNNTNVAGVEYVDIYTDPDEDGKTAGDDLGDVFFKNEKTGVRNAADFANATKKVAGFDKGYGRSVVFSVTNNGLPAKNTKYTCNYKITLTDTENADAKPVAAGINFAVKDVETASVANITLTDVSGTTKTANTYSVFGTDRDGFTVCGFYLSEHIGKAATYATAARRNDKSNRIYLQFTDPSGNFRHATVATVAAVVGHAGPEPGLTVATFTPIEDARRAGLPVVNANSDFFAPAGLEAMVEGATAAPRFYPYTSIKARMYNKDGQIGAVQTLGYSAPEYGKLTWVWTNSGAYSHSTDAAGALEECVVFTYSYTDKDSWYHSFSGTWNQLTNGGISYKKSRWGVEADAVSPALGNVLGISYVKTNADVRFEYAYVEQIAAAGIANFTVDANINLAAEAGINDAATRLDSEAEFFCAERGTVANIWTAVKIDRSTKLAE